jgi:hypothetical protein
MKQRNPHGVKEIGANLTPRGEWIFSETLAGRSLRTNVDEAPKTDEWEMTDDGCRSYARQVMHSLHQLPVKR